MDKKGLLKLADYVEKVPKQGFNQHTWSEVIDGATLNQTHVENDLTCGMAACLGGWATVVFPRRLHMMMGGSVEEGNAYGFIIHAKSGVREGQAFAKAFDICEGCACKLTDGDALHDTPKKAANALRRFVNKGLISRSGIWPGPFKINPNKCKYTNEKFACTEC